MPATRRLALALLAALLLPAWGEAPDPVAFVSAIYQRVTAGKGDGGGQFLWVEKANRRGAFSRRTADLWDKAEAQVAPGDAGPIEFDPLTNSQDPQVKSVEAKLERSTPERTTVAATLTGPGYRGPDRVIRYDLVQEGGAWRIDNIRGVTSAQPWSLREMLQAAMNP